MHASTDEMFVGDDIASLSYHIQPLLSCWGGARVNEPADGHLSGATRVCIIIP